MKKKTTDEARRFWELAEKTSKQVKTWPTWKQQFAKGIPTQSTVIKPSVKTAKTGAG